METYVAWLLTEQKFVWLGTPLLSISVPKVPVVDQR